MDQFEDEIDLREYARVLIRNWRLIAAATLVPAASALIVSFLLPPSYEATALVAITGTRYEFEFNPLIEDTNAPVKVPPYKAMLALATADDLLEKVVAEVREALPPEAAELAEFKQMVEANASNDPSVLELTASADTPELASRIANAWGQHFVTYVNRLYQRKSDDKVFFATQLEEARSRLEAAEQSLIVFQGRNQSAVLRARLDARNSLLNSYLDSQNSLTMIVSNVRALRTQVGALPPDSASALGDDLAVLGLQIRSLNAGSGVPIEIQLAEGASLSNKTAAEQARYLGELRNTIDEQLAELVAEINLLPDEILALQGEIEELNVETSRLATSRDLARETYLSVSRKLAETEILSQSAEGDARLASLAAPPVKPVSPRKLLNTAVAGALGGMLGVFLAFFRSWWSPLGESGEASVSAPELSPGLAGDP